MTRTSPDPRISNRRCAKAAELVVVTGDPASGPMPAPVLDRLTGLGDRCRLVRGNADRELVAIRNGEWSEHSESRWSAGQLRPDQVHLLINPGIIGMPYGRAGGAWALLRDGQVSLRHTPVDLDAAVAAVVAGSSYPDRVAWAEEVPTLGQQ